MNSRTELNEQVERAAKAHRSVPDTLKSSPIVLRRPNSKTLHTIEQPLVGKDLSQLEEFKFVSHAKFRSPKVAENKMPHLDDIEWALRDEWYLGGDHYLLKKILEAGRVPAAWPEYWSPQNPPSQSHAYEIATKRGYNIPQQFLDNKEPSHSETEAFNAAYSFISGDPSLFRGRSWWDNDDLRLWRPWLCQLTGQFVVPDPLMPKKSPYVIDQLWITLATEKQVRLVALEVDGEIHLDKEHVERDARRDVMLSSMGYEMHHVAGWWCRIDPYRVIAEFLAASGICSSAKEHIQGSELNSIHDYYCGLCKQPMVRWDTNWIQEIRVDGKTLVAHKYCAEEFRDNYSEDYNSGD